MALFDRLFDQVLNDPGDPDHRGSLATEPGTLLSSVVVDDRGLAELDRNAPAGLAVTVINSTGAGGITALQRRTLANCRLVAVETALRDPGDLAGNVARVAAAARELDAEVTVLVRIPDGFGWQDAIATAEAEGLVAVLSTGPDQRPDELARQLSAYVEADLPFIADNLRSADELVGLLAAVDVLIETGAVDEAAAVLTGDHDQQGGAIRDWTDNRAASVRRRLRTIRSDNLPVMITELAAYGLIRP